MKKKKKEKKKMGIWQKYVLLNCSQVSGHDY